jgi:phosphatidylglycerophosphate synthase
MTSTRAERSAGAAPGGSSGRSERFREALGRLASAQKPRAQTPAYLRYVNRRLGGWVAAGGYAVGRTPDQLTMASAGLTTAGALVVALVAPTWWSGVLAGLLMLTGYAVDSADGQLARLRGGGSPAGEWLDHVVDVVKTCAVHIAVAVAAYRFVELPAQVLLVPMLFLTASVTAFFATMLRDQLLRARGTAAAPGGDSLVRALLLLPIDHGVLCLTFLLLGAPSVFAAAYAVLTVLTGLFTARVLVRCHRALSRT